MKLVLKRTVAVVVFMIAVVTGVLFLSQRTAKNTQPGPGDQVNLEAFASCDEYAEAVIIPNNVEITAQPIQKMPEYAASEYTDKVVAYVDDFLPIRSEATRESDTVGKMYPGSIGDVLERGETWSKIRSGEVEGYIQNIFVCFDSEAEDLAIMLGGAEALRVAISIEEEEAQKAEEERIKAAKKAAEEAAKKAAAEAAAKKAAEEASKAAAEAAAKKAAEEASKAAAEAAAKKAAEEASKAAAEAAAKRAAEEASKLAETSTQVPTEVLTEPATEVSTEISTEAASVSPYYMDLSEDDIYLIACIVDWEANAEVYEGKLAVANVILNRVRSSAYPNTVSGVIYQRSQFGGVLDSAGNYSSRWQMRLSNGPRNQECYQAAREAAAGVNNVIGYYAFNGTQYSDIASFRSYIIIGNHCFYIR